MAVEGTVGGGRGGSCVCECEHILYEGTWCIEKGGTWMGDVKRKAIESCLWANLCCYTEL